MCAKYHYYCVCQILLRVLNAITIITMCVPNTIIIICAKYHHNNYVCQTSLCVPNTIINVCAKYYCVPNINIIDIVCAKYYYVCQIQSLMCAPNTIVRAQYHHRYSYYVCQTVQLKGPPSPDSMCHHKMRMAPSWRTPILQKPKRQLTNCHNTRTVRTQHTYSTHTNTRTVRTLSSPEQLSDVRRLPVLKHTLHHSCLLNDTYLVTKRALAVTRHEYQGTPVFFCSVIACFYNLTLNFRHVNHFRSDSGTVARHFGWN
jgi:hypothetical protein